MWERLVGVILGWSWWLDCWEKGVWGARDVGGFGAGAGLLGLIVIVQDGRRLVRRGRRRRRVRRGGRGRLVVRSRSGLPGRDWSGRRVIEGLRIWGGGWLYRKQR